MGSRCVEGLTDHVLHQHADVVDIDQRLHHRLPMGAKRPLGDSDGHNLLQNPSVVSILESVPIDEGRVRLPDQK
jgi:hypothetical protein